jgi:hypothetical protein
MTLESFLEGHMRLFDWLGGVPRECVYDNVRSVVARREGDVVRWNGRFRHLRGHYAFHSTACTPATPREKGSVEGAVRHLKTGFWPARRIVSLEDLDAQYRDWRDSVCNRRLHATVASPFMSAWPRSASGCGRCRPSASTTPTPGRAGCARRVPALPRLVYRAPAALVHRSVTLKADRDLVWLVHPRGGGRPLRAQLRARQLAPTPMLRPEPPPRPQPAELAVAPLAPPELRDYAALSA